MIKKFIFRSSWILHHRGDDSQKLWAFKTVSKEMEKDGKRETHKSLVGDHCPFAETIPIYLSNKLPQNLHIAISFSVWIKLTRYNVQLNVPLKCPKVYFCTESGWFNLPLLQLHTKHICIRGVLFFSSGCQPKAEHLT